MESFKRGSDGRRRFSSEFRKQVVQRVGRQEQSVAEISRELGVTPSLIYRWVRLSEGGSDAAVGANEAVVPASELRLAQQRIKELERALGRKTMEVEILQAARDEIKKKPHFYGVLKK
jgi:transposase-like protein